MTSRNMSPRSRGDKELLNKQPAVCDFLAGAKKLSARTAIQYAKAVLLRGIGLIDDAAFGACMRGFGVNAQPGIGDPGTGFQFTDNLNFGYFDQADKRMFGVAGDGADSAQFLLRVLVKNWTAAPRSQSTGPHHHGRHRRGEERRPGRQRQRLRGAHLHRRAGADHPRFRPPPRPG